MNIDSTIKLIKAHPMNILLHDAAEAIELPYGEFVQQAMDPSFSTVNFGHIVQLNMQDIILCEYPDLIPVGEPQPDALMIPFLVIQNASGQDLKALDLQATEFIRRVVAKRLGIDYTFEVFEAARSAMILMASLHANTQEMPTDGTFDNH